MEQVHQIDLLMHFHILASCTLEKTVLLKGATSLSRSIGTIFKKNTLQQYQLDPSPSTPTMPPPLNGVPLGTKSVPSALRHVRHKIVLTALRGLK